MPAYTLFVQTNRQATVMAVTQGLRLWTRNGMEGKPKEKPDRIRKGRNRTRDIRDACEICMGTATVAVGFGRTVGPAVSALDSSFLGLPNFVPFY